VADLSRKILNFCIAFVLLGFIRVVVTSSLPGFLLLLKCFQLLHDVRVNKVRNIVTLPGLGNYIILLIIGKVIILLKVHNIVIAQLELNLPLGFPLYRGLHLLLVFSQLSLHLLLPLLQGGLGDKCWSGLGVPRLGHGHTQPVHDRLHLVGFKLVVDPILQQLLAGLCLDLDDPLLRNCAHLHDVLLILSLNGLQNSALFIAQL